MEYTEKWPKNVLAIMYYVFMNGIECSWQTYYEKWEFVERPVYWSMYV